MCFTAVLRRCPRFLVKYVFPVVFSFQQSLFFVLGLHSMHYRMQFVVGRPLSFFSCNCLDGSAGEDRVSPPAAFCGPKPQEHLNQQKHFTSTPRSRTSNFASDFALFAREPLCAGRSGWHSVLRLFGFVIRFIMSLSQSAIEPWAPEVIASHTRTFASIF